jgi:hypothetical protein
MRDDVWKNLNAQPHAFTTGRSPRSNMNGPFAKNKIMPPRPSQTLKQPGKLNLKSFAIVNEAIQKMNLGENKNKNIPQIDRNFQYKAGTKSIKSKSRNAPKVPESDKSNDNNSNIDGNYEEAEYEQINDGFSEAVNNIASQLFYNQDQSSRNNKLRQRREKEQQSMIFIIKVSL